MAGLVDMFLAETYDLVRSRSKVTATEDEVAQPLDNGICAGPTAAGADIVIDTVEELLLCCSPLLEDALRASIEAAVAQLLACIAKGVIVPTTPDRRMRRLTSERLRTAPELQEKVLRLAMSEVSSSPKNGILSGNLSLLRSAAQACLGQRTTASSARKAMLLVEAFVHPTAIPIPPTPIHLLVEDRLRTRAQQQQTKSSSAWGESNVVASEDQQTDVTTGIPNAESLLKKRAFSSATPPQGGVDNGVQRPEKSSTAPVSKSLKTSADKNSEKSMDGKAQGIGSRGVEKVVSVSAAKDDSDDDLPDIDIEADPDV